MSETLTLRWRDETLTSTLTDAEAATICDRIPADHPARGYTQVLVADLRRYRSLFDAKRYWLHEHAHRQLERERPSYPTPSGALPRITAFLTPVSDKLASGARVTFASGDLTVTIKRAEADSRNPGSFYVRGLTGFGTYGSVYMGRIAADGAFFPTAECGPPVMALLDEFEADPAEYAAAYGRRTGRCCFCDAPLDDPVSMGMGYGPTCARHYRLPHGKRALAKAVAMRCARAAAAPA